MVRHGCNLQEWVGNNAGGVAIGAGLKTAHEEGQVFPDPRQHEGEPRPPFKVSCMLVFLFLGGLLLFLVAIPFLLF